jgi:hypothetical protein
VQDLRKTAGFDISDRVTTYYTASTDLAEAISKFSDYIKGETLSVDLVSGAAPAGASTSEDKFDGESLLLGLVVVKKTEDGGRKTEAKKKTKDEGRMTKAKPKPKKAAARAKRTTKTVAKKKPAARPKKTTANLKKKPATRAKAKRAGKKTSK